MPVRDPAAADSARHSAPWAVLLIVAGAVALSIGLVLDHNLLLYVLAGLLLLGGALMFGWTSLRGGRGDEPRMRARF